MIRDLGTVRPGTTIYVPFHTFDSNDPSASVTITGLAATDIEIYKDGSVTQRASDAGYTLLDTDGIDFDGVTGIHGVSINLADNTTAGFYAAGSQYWVVIASITVDAATINFLPVTFRIGYPDAIIDTTIATLASQTSFTLTVGPAEDDALNGCVVCIHDVASAVQLGFAVISDYTGSTKTVTLTAGVTFTAAATDNISIFPPSNTRWLGTVAQAGTGANLTAIPWNAAWDAEVESEVDDALGGGTGTALTAIPWNAAWDAEVESEVEDAVGADVTAVLADTNELQTDWVNGGRLDLLIDAILADTNELQTDWVNGGRLDLILDARASQTSVDTIDDFLDTEIAAILEDTGTTIDDLVDDLESRLTAALATQLTAHSLGVGRGVVDAGSSTTALVMKTVNGAAADATDDHYNGRHVVFTSGALLLQATSIADYVGATKTATIAAVTDTPAEDVTFIIV